MSGKYGPDSETDNLFLEASDSTSKNILNYIENINKTKSPFEDLVGFSVEVDKESFLRWVKENRKILIKNKLL